MTSDSDLLRRFARERTPSDFAELVRRHLNFVYATARRQLAGDTHAAEDIAQRVFVQLARQAAALVSHPLLSAWLYTTTRNQAANHVRRETRRRRWEGLASAMSEPMPDAHPDWARLRPVLDRALSALNSRDRDAVLLRFFEGRAFPAIGQHLAISDDAARRRVERALEKMRRTLSRLGVTSTVAVMAEVLAGEAAVAAPPGLAVTVGAGALGASAATVGFSLLAFMSTAKIPVAALAVLLAAGLAGVGLRRQAYGRLNAELALATQARAHTAFLLRSNARLAAVNSSPLELDRLRNETAVLQHQLAGLKAVALIPGMVPMTVWKNVGRSKPGNALETLLWAAEGADFAGVAGLIGFDSATRSEAERRFAAMPYDLKNEFGIGSPEEMVGLAFSIATQLTGAEMVQARQVGTDDVTLMVKTQSENGAVRLEPMEFQSTAAGWQWRVTHRNLDHLGSAWRAFTAPAR